MKKQLSGALWLAAMLMLSSCTTQTEQSAESSVHSAASQTTTQSTSHSTAPTTSAPLSESSAAETTIVPEAEAPHINNSAGGGYVAETADFRFYIDRDTLYRLEKKTDSTVMLLSMRGIAQLNAYNDSILYCTTLNGIYRIDAQTGDAVLVYPMTLLVGNWSPLIVTGETAYFSDGMTLRKSDLDFEQTEILYNSEHALIDQLLSANDTLYFSAYLPDSTTTETDVQSGIYACLPEGILRIYSGYCAGMTHNGDGLCISDPREQALLHLPYDTTSSKITTLCSGQFGAVCATPYGIIANDASINMVLINADMDKQVVLGSGYCLNAAEDALYYLSLTDGALCRIPFTEMQAAAAP